MSHNCAAKGRLLAYKPLQCILAKGGDKLDLLFGLHFLIVYQHLIKESHLVVGGLDIYDLSGAYHIFKIADTAFIFTLSALGLLVLGILREVTELARATKLRTELRSELYLPVLDLLLHLFYINLCQLVVQINSPF